VEVNADLLLIATDVAGVMRDFGTPRQRLIEKLDIGKAEAFLDSGAAGRGSMAPKLEAAIQFLESGGCRAVITSIAGIVDGVRGSAGTQIVAFHTQTSPRSGRSSC
jgi:carbamate kinase